MSTSLAINPPDPPQCLLDVLRECGCLWMWQLLRLIGDDNWLQGSIAAGACVTVTDGSYIRELYPNFCPAVFIFECSKGRELIVGYFSETSSVASAYCGKLLGLLAIHFIKYSAKGIERVGEDLLRLLGITN